MRDVSPASSMKLKIIYRLKTSKTANLVTISIQKFYIYNKYIYTSIMYYGWWLLSREGGSHDNTPSGNCNLL